MDNNCKDCTKRFIGCHSTCEDYKEFGQKLETVRNREKADSLVRHDNYERVQRIKRGKRK